MSQSLLVLFTKSTNHKIDYNHFSNQFKRLTLKNCGGLVSIDCLEKNLRGCPPKNRPLNSDQNFDFLQDFSTKQGCYKVKENTFFASYSR